VSPPPHYAMRRVKLCTIPPATQPYPTTRPSPRCLSTLASPT
jgi:hypothetical protein